MKEFLVHTTAVDARSAERELVEWSAEALEVEALVVVVLVRVGRAAGSGAALDVVAGRVAGSGDLAGRVVGAAASSGTSGLEGSWGGSGSSHKGKEGEELHGCRALSDLRPGVCLGWLLGWLLQHSTLGTASSL